MDVHGVAHHEGNVVAAGRREERNRVTETKETKEIKEIKEIEKRDERTETHRGRGMVPVTGRRRQALRMGSYSQRSFRR